MFNRYDSVYSSPALSEASQKGVVESVWPIDLKRVVSLVLILSSLIMAPTGFAGEPGAAQISLDEAISIAKQETGGKVMNIKTKPGIYRLKVLTPDGRVIHVNLDRATGAIVR